MAEKNERRKRREDKKNGVVKKEPKYNLPKDSSDTDGPGTKIFIGIIACLFLIATVFYVKDINKDTLKGKTVNGEDIVYTINNEDETASEWYADLADTSEPSAILSILSKEAASTLKVTDEMRENAKTQTTNALAYYQSQYGTNYKQEILNILKQMGYSHENDLEKAILQDAQLDELTKEYIKDNFDDLKVRSISYILVKKTAVDQDAVITLNEDSDNISETEQEENSEAEESTVHEATEDEKNRMGKVDAEIAEGKTFEQAAGDLSEDGSTSSNGGYLGIIDKNTTGYDETFMNTAFSLNEGEISDWVYSDQFGYFKIKCNAATPETLEKLSADSTEKANAKASASPSAAASPDATTAAASPSPAADTEPAIYETSYPENPYTALNSQNDTSLLYRAIWNKCQELGVNFNDKETQNNFLRYVGLTDLIEKDSVPEATPSASPEATAESSPETTAEASADTNN